ncbi:MAG TPA: DUF4252 domain-containing protein [Ohtaekwangia sp.]|uniref:DUF4252 domain-containing protein n=1 Tax=Ohtaekwangia sp. TaxID=2066019 RepID=UPI002F959D69
MKRIVTLLLVMASLSSFAQSKSFSTLKQKLNGAEDAVSFSIGGFVLRTALWLSDEDDDFGVIKSVRIFHVPMDALRERELKVSGFRKLLKNDAFEEMASASEDGNYITVYMQEHGKKNNLYFMLVESDDELTAIEIKGYLDPKKLLEEKSHERLTSL